MRPSLRLLPLAAAFLFALSMSASAKPPGNPKAVKEVKGLWFAEDGTPTYHIGKDGAVDWGTFVGYLRYNSICLVCHGPDGAGSSFAPDLAHALTHLDYAQFIATVAAGKKAVNAAQNLVMPSWANNKNVMCFVTEIYSYLRARSTGAVGRGRPAKHAPEPRGFQESSYKCLGIPM